MTAQLAPGRQAACHAPDVDAELFFPLVGSIDQVRDAADTARRYCATCPLLDACRRAGQHEPTGIWGGRLRYVDDRGARTSIDLLKPVPTTLKKAKRS